MAIWDTHKLQDAYERLRNRKVKNPPTLEEPDKEKGYSKEITIVTEDEGNLSKDQEVDQMELRELELERIIPYKVSTGLLVLGFFVVSFVVILTIRALLQDRVPSLFMFFSNIYLAGTIICGRTLL
jgi:hypothetical protein